MLTTKAARLIDIKMGIISLNLRINHYNSVNDESLLNCVENLCPSQEIIPSIRHSYIEQEILSQEFLQRLNVTKQSNFTEFRNRHYGKETLEGCHSIAENSENSCQIKLRANQSTIRTQKAALRATFKSAFN